LAIATIAALRGKNITAHGSDNSRLVLDATNTIQATLAVVVPVHIAVEVGYVPLVGVVAIVLRGTPPSAEAAATAEIAALADAARQSRKPVTVRTVATTPA